MQEEMKHKEKRLPSLEFIRLIGLNHMRVSKDALWIINSFNDDRLRDFIEVCSGYSSEARKIIAQSAAKQLVSVEQDKDLEQVINYFVESAPALAPFYNHSKHRFNDQAHADAQIGEWAEIAYREFSEMHYPHHREYIRGHALIFFVTGPSSSRKEAYEDRDLLRWIGANAVELAPHYDLLEEHKTWHRDFLEQLLANSSAPLSAGIL